LFCKLEAIFFISGRPGYEFVLFACLSFISVSSDRVVEAVAHGVVAGAHAQQPRSRRPSELVLHPVLALEPRPAVKKHPARLPGEVVRFVQSPVHSAHRPERSGHSPSGHGDPIVQAPVPEPLRAASLLRFPGHFAVAVFNFFQNGPTGRKLSKPPKNLSSAGPRPRISAAVDLLMKGFLEV
jgi:hypothetical protein